MQALMERVAFRPVSSIQVKPRWQLDPDLVLYVPFWNMPDGQTYLSQDAYGHTVTRTGATPTGQGYWNFDGTDDYASVPSGPWVTVATRVTVLGWTRTPVSIASALLMVSREETGGFSLGAGWTADRFSFFANTGSWVSADGTTDFVLNTWYCLGGVYDGNNVILYINGVQNAIIAQTGNMGGGTQNVTIGCKSDQLTLFWPGPIGEVHIYNRALTAGEVWDYFQRTRGRYGV